MYINIIHSITLYIEVTQMFAWDKFSVQIWLRASRKEPLFNI